MIHSSELEWLEKGIRLTQQTSFPEEQGTTLTISAAKPVDVNLKFRIPYWARTGGVKVNGQTLPAFADPGSYLVLRGPCGPSARQGKSSGSDVRTSGDDRTTR